MSASTDNASTPFNGAGTPSSHTDAAQAAAQLMELTARETEQWRVEAQAEAAALVSQAKAESATVVQAAREEAAQIVAAARAEATSTTDAARSEAYQVRESTTALRAEQEREIARLEALATQHRDQMSTHLSDLLAQVNASTERPTA